MQEIFEYDVFLSFSSNDEELVKPIWQELCLSGLRVFWSDSSLKRNIGQSWFNIIQKSLVYSRHFVLVCTLNSLKSKWVMVECETFYSQCHINSPEMRRFILLSTSNLDTSNLPPFLRNIQMAESIREIIPVIGGIDFKDLELKNQELTEQLELATLENDRLRQEINKIKKLHVTPSNERDNNKNKKHKKDDIKNKRIVEKSSDTLGYIKFTDGSETKFTWIWSSNAGEKIPYATKLKGVSQSKRMFQLSSVSKIEFLPLNVSEKNDIEKDVWKREIRKAKVTFRDGSIYESIYLFCMGWVWQNNNEEGKVEDPNIKQLSFSI